MSRRVIRSTRSNPSPLLGALSARRPLTRSQITELALPGYVALDVLYQKKGTENVFMVLAQYGVFIDVLCQEDFLQAEQSRATCLLRKLEEVHARAQHSGEWTLTEEELEAARDALALYLDQLEVATLPGIVTAHGRMTEAFKALGFQSTNAYAMAA